MDVRELRLIDTFGQYKDLDVADPPVPAPNQFDSYPKYMYLWPRLTQPARLRFNWLSAATNSVERTGQPDATPICGWVVPNYLDGSLEIYDTAGRPVGLVAEDATWRLSPGMTGTADVNRIGNAHLRQLVTYLTSHGVDFVTAFLDVIQESTLQIAPPINATQEGLAVLMGRPLALVRAELDLQVYGERAVHQGWNEFRKDMAGSGRETGGFDDVNFPIRLGQLTKLGDGLAGYWVDTDNDQYANNLYYTLAEPKATSHALIKTQAEAAAEATLTHSVNGPAIRVSMLVDPRAPVHVTTGIVPTESLAIPSAMYVSSLASIAVTFRAMPVLSYDNTVHLPLPQEGGYSWAWLQQQDGQWEQRTSAGYVYQSQLNDVSGNQAAALWTVLVAQGWITPASSGATEGAIVAKDQRTHADLPAPWTARQSEIDALLQALPILNPLTQAYYPAQVRLREGWLQLSPNG